MSRVSQDQVADEQFESLERQAHAARLGMWVFLASEILLFTTLFALYAGMRAHHPAEMRAAVHENTKLLGSINTAVMLISSTLAASSVRALRASRARLSALLLGGTITLGAVFLVIKVVEYLQHFARGIYPGGRGAFFAEHGVRGTSGFWSLYYTMTGLHALHVVIGMSVLGFMLVSILRGKVTPARPHRLEIGAIYWHLVDVVWIFLWPLFYLA